MHGVLATIGASTSATRWAWPARSFMGQFGIGLLSCFVVADEIRVPRRAGSDETWLWVGRDDGTYAVSAAPEPRRARHGRRHPPRGSGAYLLSADVVERLATSFAAHLRSTRRRDRERPGDRRRRAFPWEEGEGAARRAATTRWCERVLGFTRSTSSTCPTPQPACADWPSCSRTPRLPAAPTASTRSGCCVGDSVTDVLPEWAFVRAVLDADGLGLTASRESLHTTRPCTRPGASRRAAQARLLRMARTDRVRADDFFRVHHLAAKAAATTDDDMLDVVAELLPWETTSAHDARRVRPRPGGGLHRPGRGLPAGGRDRPGRGHRGAQRGLRLRPAARRPLGAAHARAGVAPAEPEHLADRFTAPTPQEEAAFAPLLDVARSVLGRARAVPVVRSFRRSRCTPCSSSVATPTGSATGSRSPRRLWARGPTRSTASPRRMPCRGSCSTPTTPQCGARRRRRRHPAAGGGRGADTAMPCSRAAPAQPV